MTNRTDQSFLTTPTNNAAVFERTNIVVKSAKQRNKEEMRWDWRKKEITLISNETRMYTLLTRYVNKSAMTHPRTTSGIDFRRTYVIYNV